MAMKIRSEKRVVFEESRNTLEFTGRQCGHPGKQSYVDYCSKRYAVLRRVLPTSPIAGQQAEGTEAEEDEGGGFGDGRNCAA
jgi:hypothetical protein